MTRAQRTIQNFLGLHRVDEGPTAPPNSAEDMVNIDLQFNSIRGRAPSERIVQTIAPTAALNYDGQHRWMFSDYTTNEFALDDDTFEMQVYVSRIDVKDLLAHDANTNFVIAESSGASTTITPTEGWILYLTNPTATNLRLVFAWHDGTGNFTTEIDDVEDQVDDIDTALAITVTRSGGTMFLDIYKDGSTTPADSDSTAGANPPNAGASHRLTVGALEYSTGNNEYFAHFNGIISQLNIFRTDVAVSTLWNAINPADLLSLLDFTIQLTEGEGYEVEVRGQDTWTNTQAGVMTIRPQPVVNNSGTTIRFDRLSYGDLDLSNITLDGVEGWGFIVGLSLLEPVINASEPPFAISTRDSNLVVTFQQGTDSHTQYKISVSLALQETVSGTFFNVSVTTADLVIGATEQRIAAFIETDYSAAAASTTLNVYLETAGGGFALVASDTATGLPISELDFRFASNINQRRWCKFDVHDFRFFLNLPIPANAAAVDTLDVYDPTFPNGLLVSFDGSVATTITTRGSENRVTEWRDNRTGNHAVKFFPEHGPDNWASLDHIDLGTKSKVLGVIPSIESRGGTLRRLQNIILRGGAYQFDQDAGTGTWLQHPSFSGNPQAGLRGIEFLDRLLVYGDEMEPFKLYPGGAGVVGLPRPFVSVTTASSAATPGGGLLGSTRYDYQFTVYNSLTGLESMPYQEDFDHTTGAGDDTITLTIIDIRTNGTDDWDTIRVYRKIQQADLFQLEQEVPRPVRLPPEGASILITSKLKEEDLLLNELIEITNFQLPSFTAAEVMDNRLHVTGAGPNPGRLIASNLNEFESYDPLVGVRNLDDDDSNRGMAVFEVSNRILILKQRNIWSAPESYIRTGEEPTLLHRGRGCVGPGAAVRAVNVVFFVSPDRTIYATDGFQMEDVSSDRIKKTLFGYTDAQLALTQSAHDAQSKRVWFLINGQVLVYSYDDNRWTIYEIPMDSLGTGHKETPGAGEHAVWGFRGSAYRLNYNSQANKESDAGGGNSTWVATYTGGSIETDDDGDIWSLDGTTFDASIEGMPLILVGHAAARQGDPAVAGYNEPLFEETTREFNHVAGVSGDKLYLGTPSNIADTFITAYIGQQYRRYLHHRFAPQGEGFPYLFFDITFLQSLDVPGTSSSVLRFRFDDRTPFLYTRVLTGGVRDRSFSTRRRGRSWQFLIEQFERDDLLEVQEIIPRYRVRAPRRLRS